MGRKADLAPKAQIVPECTRIRKIHIISKQDCNLG